MPFLLILAVLSLIIIIPISFSYFAKKKSTQIPNHPSKTIATTPTPINFLALPTLFQQMITDIEHLYQQIEQKHRQNSINPESWHTIHRLFFTRLPEILGDYHRLEPHYATSHIVDSTQNLTSYDLVHQQLKSILNFFHQINQSSNQQYLQNILTNQRYLQTVLDDNSIANPSVQPLLPSFDVFNPTEVETKNNVDYEIGLQYLATYITEPNRLPNDFIQTLGQFSYFASITQLAVQDQLGYALAKLNLTADLQLEAVQDIVQVQIPQIFSQNSLEKIDIIKLKSALENLTVLLKQMLLTLDKPLPLADKLAFLQNLHDDMVMGFTPQDFKQS